MISCFGDKEECLRDTMREDFVAYRQWYGISPLAHEREIHLGDLGRFGRDGEFIRLGNIFESSDKTILNGGFTAEKFVGVKRPDIENIEMSEEILFDPFVSPTTAWSGVPQDQIASIRFLALRRADRSSLTYEYVKPSSALQFAQLKPGQWAHALLLGGPLQRRELRNPGLKEWFKLNSRALRRQLDLDRSQRDDGYGLVVVLTTYTSPAFTDVRFLNRGENLVPVVMGCASGTQGNAKWLRGYPTDIDRQHFEGEFVTNEGQPVEEGWTIFIDGCSIKKASRWTRFVRNALGMIRGKGTKKGPGWKSDISVVKISEM